MALTPAQVAAAWKEYTDELHGPAESAACRFTKTQLQSAVEAIDGWIDANQASFNSALPAAFRNNATAAEKAALFMYVLMKRFRG